MNKINLVFALFIVLFFSQCKNETDETVSENTTAKPFVWEGANVYFLLTDRFNNGDTTNDVNFERTAETGALRNFMGGDLRGIIQKIDSNYFTDLGINAIWMTPIVEQIHGSVDEGTGNTYAYHGYWAKDWTSLDPNFGTREDLAELVEKAHAKGIRVVLDAVINHTGPVTEKDPVYPENWVRTSPKCTYDSYKNYIECTLVENLPDVLTESNEEVGLPQELITKWKENGTYEQELVELDAFFEKTGYPRAPKYYIMKWLADYIVDFGIDGYRVDTVKHTTEDVWQDFSKVCQISFNEFKANNPEKVLDENPFYLIGEVYNYGIHGAQNFDFGDKTVNYFKSGFNNLINFDFKSDAKKSYEEIFGYYNTILQSEMQGFGVMNYGTSHDDGSPFDKQRNRTYEMATKLLLAPGISQIYYGDETARSLEIEKTEGDATLRSFMNWDDIYQNKETNALLTHYQKLGKFRANHPAVGAGKHQQISDAPYTFSRTYQKDNFKDVVLVALDLPNGTKTLETKSVFEEGAKVRDVYSGFEAVVKNGKVTIESNFNLVLLEIVK
uniref:alpha-amylase family glycosyl hydrolase n=1 Tax=Flavobacterium sp. TaxID=239 RepID=UPI00404AD4A3